MTTTALPIAGTPATLVRADNPGPMTLDGTNTWIVHDPQASSAVVIDPGPDDAVLPGCFAPGELSQGLRDEFDPAA